MKTVWIAVLAAMAAVSLGGCGTICNFAHGDPDIYGGVQKDVEIIQTPRTAGGGGVSYNKGSPIFAVLVLADTGLSLVADTLTLPLAIYLRQNEHASDNEGVPMDGGNPVKSADKATPAISLEESRPDGRGDAEEQGAKNEAGESVHSDSVEIEMGEKRSSTSRLPTNVPQSP
jgi:uncharacterized protein YceK